MKSMMITMDANLETMTDTTSNRQKMFWKMKKTKEKGWAAEFVSHI